MPYKPLGGREDKISIQFSNSLNQEIVLPQINSLSFETKYHIKIGNKIGHQVGDTFDKIIGPKTCLNKHFRYKIPGYTATLGSSTHTAAHTAGRGSS